MATCSRMRAGSLRVGRPRAARQPALTWPRAWAGCGGGPAGRRRWAGRSPPWACGAAGGVGGCGWGGQAWGALPESFGSQGAGHVPVTDCLPADCRVPDAAGGAWGGLGCQGFEGPKFWGPATGCGGVGAAAAGLDTRPPARAARTAYAPRQPPCHASLCPWPPSMAVPPPAHRKVFHEADQDGGVALQAGHICAEEGVRSASGRGREGCRLQEAAGGLGHGRPTQQAAPPGVCGGWGAVSAGQVLGGSHRRHHGGLGRVGFGRGAGDNRMCPTAACCLGGRLGLHIVLFDHAHACLHAVGTRHRRIQANPKLSVRHPPGLHLQQAAGCPVEAPHGCCTPLDACGCAAERCASPQALGRR